MSEESNPNVVIKLWQCKDPDLIMLQAYSPEGKLDNYHVDLYTPLEVAIHKYFDLDDYYQVDYLTSEYSRIAILSKEKKAKEIREKRRQWNEKLYRH